MIFVCARLRALHLLIMMGNFNVQLYVGDCVEHLCSVNRFIFAGSDLKIAWQRLITVQKSSTNMVGYDILLRGEIIELLNVINLVSVPKTNICSGQSYYCLITL